MEKVLIAYYSRRGGNYVDGKVKSLSIGNTERAAYVLQRLTGGDLFQIEQLIPYPEDYYKCIDKARQDLIRGVRPELKKLPDHLDRYKTIYLGYPNYWRTMPMAVFSFLERLDFTGKRLKPFCTYSNSGMGRSEQDLRQICPTAHITTGFPIHGADAEFELSVLQEWMRETED